MLIKIYGAIITFGICTVIGFQSSFRYLNQIRLYKDLLCFLDDMTCELQFKRPALPELCKNICQKQMSPISNVFRMLSITLEQQHASTVSGCMKLVLDKSNDLPLHVAELLQMLGDTLGRFDLDGQLVGIASVKRECNYRLETLLKEKPEHIRLTRTLAFCTGAGLIILFI